MEIQMQEAKKAQEIVRIPEGMYSATFVAAKEGKTTTFVVKGKDGKAVKNQDGTDKTRDVKSAVLEFAVMYKEKKYSLFFKGYEPAKPTNKLGNALMAMGVKDFNKTLNIDVLIGHQVRVLVEDWKPEEPDSVVRSVITKVKPLEEVVE